MSIRKWLDETNAKAMEAEKEREQQAEMHNAEWQEPDKNDKPAQGHTPGPWTVVLRGERGTFYIPEAQKHEAANTDDGVDGHTVSSANARLIAAAPDLLAACKRLVARLEYATTRLEVHNTKDNEAIEQADAVIAKAEGRAE